MSSRRWLLPLSNSNSSETNEIIAIKIRERELLLEAAAVDVVGKETIKLRTYNNEVVFFFLMCFY